MCARRRFLIPSNKSHLRQPTPKKSLVCVAAGTPRRTRGRDTAGSPADGGIRTWPGDRLSCPQLRYFSHVDFIHFSFFPLLSKTDALYYDRLSLSPLTGSITRFTLLLILPSPSFPVIDPPKILADGRIYTCQCNLQKAFLKKSHALTPLPFQLHLASGLTTTEATMAYKELQGKTVNGQ